jgi:flagellar basal-body rod protein FlgB
MDLTPSQFDLLSRLLDVASLRHQVTAQNVANVNTPGYRALEVSFDEAFARHLARGETASALSTRAAVVEAPTGIVRADGNNVDIDREMARLTGNQLVFTTLAQVLASRLATLRTAVTGR